MTNKNLPGSVADEILSAAIKNDIQKLDAAMAEHGIISLSEVAPELAGLILLECSDVERDHDPFGRKGWFSTVSAPIKTLDWLAEPGRLDTADRMILRDALALARDLSEGNGRAPRGLSKRTKAGQILIRMGSETLSERDKYEYRRRMSTLLTPGKSHNPTKPSWASSQTVFYAEKLERTVSPLAIALAVSGKWARHMDGQINQAFNGMDMDWILDGILQNMIPAALDGNGVAATIASSAMFNLSGQGQPSQQRQNIRWILEHLTSTAFLEKPIIKSKETEGNKQARMALKRLNEIGVNGWQATETLEPHEIDWIRQAAGLNIDGLRSGPVKAFAKAAIPALVEIYQSSIKIDINSRHAQETSSAEAIPGSENTPRKTSGRSPM